MDTEKILHYPRLDNVLVVEKIIYEYSGAYTKKQLWDRLPRKMMYQTFSAIIDYLVYSRKIIINNNGKIIWTTDMQLEYLNKKVDTRMNKEVEKISRRIVNLLKSKGIIRAGVFGSYAREEQKKGSDVDILIEIEHGKKFGLFDLVGLEDELKRRLKKKVDLVTYNSLHHLIRSQVLKEEERII